MKQHIFKVEIKNKYIMKKFVKLSKQNPIKENLFEREYLFLLKKNCTASNRERNHLSQSCEDSPILEILGHNSPHT